MRRAAFISIVHIMLLIPAGIYGAFQDMFWGARPSGMGGAFVAISDDANAPVWNPAGIYQIEKRTGSFMFSKLYAGLEGVDLGLKYFSYVHPLRGIGGIGAAWTSYGFNDIYTEDVYALSSSILIRESSPNLALGFNIKYLSHRYVWDDEIRDLDDPVVLKGDSSGMATFDTGLLFKPGRVSLGILFRNITEPDVGINYEDIVQMETRYGVAYQVRFDRALSSMNVAVDFASRGRKIDINNPDVFFGIEGWFSEDSFGIRTGINREEYSFGASLVQEINEITFLLDYSISFSKYIRDNSGSSRLSTSIRF